jgi:hypothetical protein
MRNILRLLRGGACFLGILMDLWKWAQDEQLFLKEIHTKVSHME